MDVQESVDIVDSPSLVNDTGTKTSSFKEATDHNLLQKNFGVIRCTVCSEQINPFFGNDLNCHPFLDVIICKKCFKFLVTDENDWKRDDEGQDEYCRWCGEGGDIFTCDFCPKSFCRICLRKNLGRAYLSSLENVMADKWRCLVCDPEVLKPLQKMLNDVRTFVSDSRSRRRSRYSDKKGSNHFDKKEYDRSALRQQTGLKILQREVQNMEKAYLEAIKSSKHVEFASDILEPLLRISGFFNESLLELTTLVSEEEDKAEFVSRKDNREKKNNQPASHGKLTHAISLITDGLLATSSFMERLAELNGYEIADPETRKEINALFENDTKNTKIAAHFSDDKSELRSSNKNLAFKKSQKEESKKKGKSSVVNDVPKPSQSEGLDDECSILHGSEVCTDDGNTVEDNSSKVNRSLTKTTVKYIKTKDGEIKKVVVEEPVEDVDSISPKKIVTKLDRVSDSTKTSAEKVPTLDNKAASLNGSNKYVHKRKNSGSKKERAKPTTSVSSSTASSSDNVTSSSSELDESSSTKNDENEKLSTKKKKGMVVKTTDSKIGKGVEQDLKKTRRSNIDCDIQKADRLFKELSEESTALQKGTKRKLVELSSPESGKFELHTNTKVTKRKADVSDEDDSGSDFMRKVSPRSTILDEIPDEHSQKEENLPYKIISGISGFARRLF